MEPEPEVLVAGAGPTGLTRACGLLASGVTVRVVDKAAAPAGTSRALGLQPRGIGVMERLGALQAALTIIGRRDPARHRRGRVAFCGREDFPGSASTRPLAGRRGHRDVDQDAGKQFGFVGVLPGTRGPDGGVAAQPRLPGCRQPINRLAYGMIPP